MTCSFCWFSSADTVAGEMKVIAEDASSATVNANAKRRTARRFPLKIAVITQYEGYQIGDPFLCAFLSIETPFIDRR